MLRRGASVTKAPTYVSDEEDSERDDSGSEAEEASDSADEKVILGESSDSDDAPDDVDFTASRQMALEKIRETLGLIQDEKNKTKAKRRHREEMFTEQKKQKLADLEKLRLPAELLQAAVLCNKQKPLAKPVMEEDEDEAEAASGSSSEDEEGEQDVIPLSGGLQAVPVKEALQKKNLSQQNAEEFRQNRLYHSGIPRHSVTELRAQQAKRRVRRK